MQPDLLFAELPAKSQDLRLHQEVSHCNDLQQEPDMEWDGMQV